ncbi:hypothetical protein JQX08_04980 [Pseudomonas sp. UL073]|uniref:Uncharacterized protein n=1 Tax=Zestomonas insulae TaxID=2809017 RepID=A0ABS2ID19_9GAMM|nr:hypothetical protein [Pseudomonas insulae]MBM7060053.1 hypothetical protein [Pseudomonas insulae]
MKGIRKDRLVAVATPAAIIAATYLSGWFTLLLPAGLYFIYKKCSLDLSKNVALKIFDLIISIAILIVVIAIIVGALRIVARDGEFTIPFISSDLLVPVVSSILAGYCMASFFVTGVKALKGKEHKPALSLGIFEALRGKRITSSSSEQKI